MPFVSVRREFWMAFFRREPFMDDSSACEGGTGSEGYQDFVGSSPLYRPILVIAPLREYRDEPFPDLDIGVGYQVFEGTLLVTNGLVQLGQGLVGLLDSFMANSYDLQYVPSLVMRTGCKGLALLRYLLALVVGAHVGIA